MKTELVLKAIRFAEKYHEGQFRKVSGLPYVSHPVAVSYLIMKYKGASKNITNLLAAYILHDTLEDTSLTMIDIGKEFNNMIASIVFELTTDEEQKNLLGKKRIPQA